MSLTSFVVCKSWVSNPLRTALTVLGIAAGVAIVVAIFVMDHNTIATQMLRRDPERGPVDLAVMPLQSRPVEAVVADLRQRPGVAGVAIWREARASLTHGQQHLDVAVFGLQPLPGGLFEHYAVAAGRDLNASDGDGAVLLGAEAARLLEAVPGTRIALREPLRGSRYECRNGKLEELPQSQASPFTTEVTVAGVLAPSRIGKRNFGQVLVGSRALAQRLFPAGADLFQLQRHYGADLDRLRQDLEHGGYTLADVRAAQIGEGADERAFRNGLKVVGCLALLLGMFVVFQTLSQSLVARVRLLGLLRCLGAGRGSVVRIFLGDALVLGCAGSVVGLLLGVGIAAVLRRYNISSLGGDKEWLTFELPLLPMVWTAGLGIVFTLAGAAFPLWRARQLPALWILRQPGLGKGGDDDLLAGVNVWLFVLLVLLLPLAYLAMTPLVAEEGQETLYVLLEMGGMIGAVGGLLLLAPVVLAFLGRLLLLPLQWAAPLAAWLCRKTIERQSGRVASGVVGLAAVLLAFLGLKSITESLRGDVYAFGATTLNGRAFVEVPARTVSSTAGWAQIPGVEAVAPIEGEVAGDFLLRGLDVTAVARRGGALEGRQDLIARYAGQKERTMIVSHRLALKKKWDDGYLVPMLDRNQVAQTYRVLTVSDASGYWHSEQAWAITAPHWLRTDFCVGENCVQYATLHLQPGADPTIVGDRLSKLEPQRRRYFTGDEIREYHLRDVDRDFYIFDLLLLLILGLAGTGLLNGMTIAALSRVRELGVLRALGVDRRTLRQSLLFEGLLVGLLASLLALVLCVPMAHVLVAGLNRVAALNVPVVLPSAWMTTVPAIAVALGVLAAWLPAVRVARQDPAASVRCE